MRDSQHTCKRKTGVDVNTSSSCLHPVSYTQLDVYKRQDMDKFANEDEDHLDAEEYVAVQTGIDEVKNKNVFVCLLYTSRCV